MVKKSKIGTDEGGRLADTGMAAVSALVTALVAAYIAVSLCKGTLHIVAFFWCALVAGLMAAHTAAAIRKLRKKEGKPKDN